MLMAHGTRGADQLQVDHKRERAYKNIKRRILNGHRFRIGFLQIFLTKESEEFSLSDFPLPGENNFYQTNIKFMRTARNGLDE